MELYHVIMGTTDINAMNLFPDKTINYLLAASMQTFDQRWKKNLPLIERKKKLLFSDSGMLGWIKKLGDRAWSYASNPQGVLEIQLQSNPDIISHVDIPMEYSITERLGKTTKESMDQTILNAIWLVKKKLENRGYLNGKRIAIAVQGRTLDDYIQCIHRYRDLGFMDLNPKDFLFAIGSVCMKKPPDLYEISKIVRVRIPEQYDLHCFGIANIKWLLQLEQIGITSCDSSTDNFASAMYRIVGEDGRQSTIKLSGKNTLMQNSLFAFNIASLEFQLKNKMIPVMDELFFDESEQYHFCQEG